MQTSMDVWLCLGPSDALLHSYYNKEGKVWNIIMYLSFGENSLFLTKENEIATSLEITFEDL